MKTKDTTTTTSITKINSNKSSNKNYISLKADLEDKGDKKRRKTQADYHSSDGRRNSATVNNLIGFQYQLSQSKLLPLKHKNETEIEGSTVNVDYSKKNIPSITQNVSNINLQEAKDITKSKIDNQRNEAIITKKSKIKVYKCKYKAPSMDDDPPRSKMSTYVFGTKDDKNNTQIDKSSTVLDPPTPQNKSATPIEESKDDHEKIKEENNKLIEQMLMNRKRQYSCTSEMNGQLSSKLLQKKK